MSLAEWVPFEETMPHDAEEVSALDVLASATTVLELLRLADQLTPPEIDLWAALVVEDVPQLYVHAPRPPGPGLIAALAESMRQELSICCNEHFISVIAPAEAQTSCLQLEATMLNDMCQAWRDHVTERGETVVGLSRAGATSAERLTIDRWRRADEVLEVTAWMLGALTDDQGRERGVVDPITGAYSRAFFEEMLRLELGRQARVATELSLMMLQLRASSRVLEDAPVPPAVLAVAATVMQATLRRSDVVARLDGRRLVGLLPGTSPRSGLIAATRVGEALHDCRELEGWSVDVGVSGVGIEVTDGAELLAQAEHAMLAAQRGRAQTPFVYL